MKVLLIHAYSTTNSGDGLLVDEAADLIVESLPGASYTILALDPTSFKDFQAQAVLHPLTGRSESVGSALTLAHGLVAFVRGRRNERIEKLIDESDLVVAVGGGYLRAKSPVEAVKTLFTHFVQLPRRSDSVPFIYLPQSIGPLNFGLKRAFASRLRFAHSVIARDDRSTVQLADLSNVDRAPDMALLGMPGAWNGSNVVEQGTTRLVGIVARKLSTSKRRASSYSESIRQLGISSSAEFLAQATARGNNDPDFYESLGLSGPFRSLREAVGVGSEARPSVVVSVRLHGSIQTIRSGVPSIHLSYERKGWGAFSDLGISRFVHNAFDFDRDLVLSQIEELRSDPSEYWNAVLGSLTYLAGERTRLIELVRLSATVDRTST